VIAHDSGKPDNPPRFEITEHGAEFSLFRGGPAAVIGDGKRKMPLAKGKPGREGAPNRLIRKPEDVSNQQNREPVDRVSRWHSDECRREALLLF
jgi:hypothetical protein